jgi:predicted enzyme related to lactoylglutathione lyase
MVERVTQAGGSLHRAAENIPGVGRFAFVHDPQDAHFVLFTPAAGSRPPSSPGPTPGQVGWRELLASDREAAFAFYANLFGWTKANAVDMGPMGLYQLFAAGGPDIGGIMTKPPAVPHAFWTYYFIVEAIDAATARVTEAGGRIVNGPHEVPGGSWIAQAFDPQGAFFAMVAPTR